MNPNYAALSASDGAGEPVRATVQANRSIGSSSITVNATTNWPTGTFIATTGTLQSNGTLNPATVQVFYGTASGTIITISSFAAGYSDLGNSINDIVVIKPTTEWANVVADGILGTAQFPNNFSNFVEPAAGIWSVSSGLAGTATAGYVWYEGTRSSMAAVTSHTFTASKDTYVDYNPSTAGWTYVAETNGAAQPAVTSGCVRVAKVVTGSSTISSISQTLYQSPTPGAWHYLGSTQITSGFSTTNTSATQVTGLTVTVTVPAGYTQVKISVSGRDIYNGSGAAQVFLTVWRGTVSSGTQVGSITANSSSQAIPATMFVLDNPGSGSVTYNIGLHTTSGSDPANLEAGATYPTTLVVDYC